MPYVSTDVLVELDDFDIEDLIEEIESRGHTVIQKQTNVSANALDREMEEVIWRYTRGYIEDAMILLERIYPDLYGLHKRIK